MIKLMIKEHVQTGLKYLCKTVQEDHDSYLGSGHYWRRHLKKHGTRITTQVIFQTLDETEFRKKAKEWSKRLDVVNSKEWANEVHEEGSGGDTVSMRRWITDGKKDRYILKTEEVPYGWNLGRSTGAFVNSEKQKEFNQRTDRNKAGESIKKAWSNKENNKFGTRITGLFGKANPASSPEIRKKISESAIRNMKPFLCKKCGRTLKRLGRHNLKCLSA